MYITKTFPLPQTNVWSQKLVQEKAPKPLTPLQQRVFTQILLVYNLVMSPYHPQGINQLLYTLLNTVCNSTLLCKIFLNVALSTAVSDDLLSMEIAASLLHLSEEVMPKCLDSREADDKLLGDSKGGDEKQDTKDIPETSSITASGDCFSYYSLY